MKRSAAGEIALSWRATSAHDGTDFQAGEYLARDDVAAGSLREVLPATRKIYALYLPSRCLPPQVRAFVDLLVRNATSRPA